MLGWSVAARLQYEQVSQYVDVDAAPTTVLLVGVQATDCSAPIGQTVLSLNPGDHVLVAGFGEASNLTVGSFIDEGGPSSGSQARLRAIDAGIFGGTLSTDSGVGTSVDFYLASSGTNDVLFGDVPFGGTAPQGGGVDADGYITTAPIANADLRVRRHADLVDVLDDPGFSADAQHAYSIFLTGTSLSGQSSSTLQVVLCDDSAAPVGHLFPCTAGGTEL
jgi:hypothetical protein